MIPGNMGTAWCPTCRKSSRVMDEYTTGPLGAEYVAKPLQCGHDANDGGSQPSRRRFVPDPTLVGRLVSLQQRSRP